MLAGCARDVTLGDQTGSTGNTTLGAGCQRDAQCGAGQRCIANVCQTVAASCDPQQACATADGTFCSDSCPTCTSGERCCMDNGFGQCQCFCGLSCGGPSCAPEGVAPGPTGASCGADADCLCGEQCGSGTCQAGPLVVTCVINQDCANAGCGADSCVNNRCVPPNWQCVNDRECGGDGSGESCQGGGCVCVSRSGQSCVDSSSCAGCAGEFCNQGFCAVHTSTTSGATGTATAGGSTGGFGSTSGSTTGSTSGSGSGGCACNADADCNDAYHEGYICSGGFCAPGPTSATLSSTGGLCAGPASSSGSSTSGSGTTSGSGSGGTSATSGTT